MNEEEIAKLIRFVHALCPAQKMDEFTPDAWELILDDIAFDDAKAALKTLGRQLRFIAPSDIAQEVRRVRNLRAAQYTGDAYYARTLPDADPDRPLDYIQSMRAQTFRAANGLPELGPGLIEHAIEVTFRYVPSAWKRGAIPVPTRIAIETTPSTSPEYDEAHAFLRALPALEQQHWMTIARKQLEADGVLLDHQVIAVLAAELAAEQRSAA